MAKKGFLFPGLQYAGYEAGFSLRLTSELRRYSDLRVELLHFREGQCQRVVTLAVPAEPVAFFRSFESDWGVEAAGSTTTDLYCLRLMSPSQPEADLPSGGLEGQMLLRHRTYGWTSSILTGFVPLRAPGHRFAPIMHTGHCMAQGTSTETLHLFMNVCDVEAPHATQVGVLTAHVYQRDGAKLGSACYPVLANATVTISHDTIVRDCGLPDTALQQGINIKFHGGASQFAILTILRHRATGSIALEHTLAPMYYIPGIVNPAIRTLVYGQLKASA